MAANYCFRGVTNVPAYGEPGVAVVTQLVDVPALIADPSQLALVTTPNVPLTYFPGFVQGDTLSVAVPSLLVEDFGLYCTTREDGSNGNIDFTMTAAGVAFSVVNGGSGDAQESAYNPLDESDDASFPIVNIGEVIIDPASAASVLPRHSYYGNNYLRVAFLGAKSLTTAVFQVFLKGTVCFQ